MRKSTTFYLLFSLTLFSISNVIKGQGGTFEVTQNGYFESVADRFGNTINYCDLSPTSSKPLGSYTNSTNSVPSISCQAGYFILYYAQGSFLESNSSFQNVICQVFTDISNFINVPAPLSNSLSSTKIHILCSDLTTSGLAVASPLFIYPQNATNPNQGYIYNQVEKALISGTNPFLNLPVAIFSGNSLYSGYLEVNPSVNWNTNLNSLGITSTQTDLYTVVLHEAIHLLGFNSMINYNGNSKLGAANNIYTRYDKYLHTASGSPLLSSTTSTSCGNSNIVYSPTTTAILGASVGTVVDDSNCATAIQYISPTNTVSVYTPTAFTSAGSFSHFEDRCTTPPTFTPASSCTAAVIPANTNNNLYYVMTNSIGLGNCFVRRFMTEEEKNVLCDLNYSVNPTYFSSALIDANSPTTTLHTYGSGCTPTLTVYGLNDGLSNSIYTFTSTTTTAVVSYSTLLVNDFPATGLQVSCLELVYNTATFTQGLSGFTVTAPSVGSGFVLFKYLPQHISSGQFGNPTYVYVYFISPGCNPSSCYFVQNGGFESVNQGTCGVLNSAQPNILNCWSTYFNNATLFSAGCTNTQNPVYNLGINTLNYTPALSSHNGTLTNTNVLGLLGWPNNGYFEAIQNNLGSSLVPNQTYQLSFWVLNLQSSTSNTTINNGNQPCVISFASNPAYPVLTATTNFPTGLNVIDSFTINAGSQWTNITTTFVLSPSVTVNQNNLLIGFDWTKTLLLPAPTNSTNFRVFIDDIVILPVPTTSLSLPTNTICTTQGFVNIGIYFSGTSVFSGPGVTYNGFDYDFNTPPTLTPGLYPISVSYTTGTGCAYTIGETVSVISDCCSSTLTTAFTNSLYSGTGVLIGPAMIAQNVTVQQGSWLGFAGEIRVAPNVSITAEAGATIAIDAAHLMACDNDMWQGFVIKDGGEFYSSGVNGDNLIEDAKIAIDIKPQPTSTVQSILFLTQTTFNRNYIDLSIGAYQRTVAPIYATPIWIGNCVFTCRNLPFTTNSWPQVGYTSTVTGINAALRTAINPTTGLNSPYLNQSGLNVANLKNPYSNQPSHIAIRINGFGNKIGSNYFGLAIGQPSVGYYNVFDSHGRFIDAVNSNIKLENNVFQNTLRFPAVVSSNTVLFGGEAVNSRVTNYNDYSLDLTAVNTNTANHFWNCHTGISANKTYRFLMENTSFRSVQSTTALPSGSFVPQGNAGIVLNTNKFSYYIKNNEFTNINQCINIPLSAAGSCSICANLIYAGNITILQNTFSPGTGSGNYLGKAVNITSPNNFPLTVAPSSVVPYTQSALVKENVISNAFRGIYVNGITGFKTAIESNTISLADDNFFAQGQRAIELANTYAANDSSGVFEISTNVLSAQNITNSAVSLVDCSINSGTNTPVVVCNDLSNAYNGFVFNNTNDEAIWAGNVMQPMARGLVLDQSGVIGQQGTSNTVGNNKWNGTWTAPNNYCTYIGANSLAQNSPLWVKGGATSPATNFGSVFNNLWYTGPNTLFLTTGNDYQCSGLPNNKPVSVPDTANYSNVEGYYIAETVKYRFLYMNNGILNSDPIYTTFYTALQTTNTGLLMDVEQNIYDGNVSNATTILSGITPSNNIETNYADFYEVYIDYLSGLYNIDDSLSLITLARQCPGEEGGAVHQARALYNSIYNSDRIYADCGSAGNRPGKENTANTPISVTNNWNVKLFPNPSTNAVTIIGKVENEELSVQIRDVNGKLVLSKDVKTSGFIANLDLELINGVYLVTIKNSSSETTHKKLLIVK